MDTSEMRISPPENKPIKVSGPIYDQVQALQQQIYVLDEQLAQLIGRIGPVLSYDTPMESPAKDAGASSEMGSALNGMYLKILDMTHTVVRVIDRVEL